MATGTRRLHLILLTAILLAGCSTTAVRPIPDTVSQPPGNDIQLAEVTGDPQKFLGGQIRWGGSILNTQQHEGGLYIEILQRPLDNKGKPLSGRESDGRFIAKIPSPYDAKYFYRGRHITISGILNNIETRKINKQTEQALPVVNAQNHYTWNSYEKNYGYRKYYHPGYPYYHRGYYLRHRHYYPYFHHRGYYRYGRPYYGGFHFGIRHYH